MNYLSKMALFGVATCLAATAYAVEYRSVDTPAVLYDAPSQRGAKLFVIRSGTPVEVVVALGSWVKVRDAEGGLAWIEKQHLATRRTVIVRAERAAVLRKAEESAPSVFEAERNVSLDYLETLPGGWVKVRHRDGPEGFVRAGQVWGY